MTDAVKVMPPRVVATGAPLGGHLTKAQADQQADLAVALGKAQHTLSSLDEHELRLILEDEIAVRMSLAAPDELKRWHDFATKIQRAAWDRLPPEAF